MANKFKRTMYVTTYELARDGMTDAKIASALGVNKVTFYRWKAEDPALADALERGRKRRAPGDEQTFREYIFDHLSPELRDLWNEINRCENEENGIERIEALLAQHGKYARQHLFIYALTQSMFNVSQSLRKLLISRKTYENWIANDPDFAELMDEIHWHKKNYFEARGMDRIAAGDTAVILHALKTQCRDRGWNEKIEIEHTGTVTNEHAINILDLDLDVTTKKAVLEALRAKLAEEGGS